MKTARFLRLKTPRTHSTRNFVHREFVDAENDCDEPAWYIIILYAASTWTWEVSKIDGHQPKRSGYIIAYHFTDRNEITINIVKRVVTRRLIISCNKSVGN